MPSSSFALSASRCLVLVGIAVSAITGCAAGWSSKAGVYEVREEPVTLGAGRALELTYVKPAKSRSPVTMVLFATGDAGWMGTSGKIFEHMAGEGYYIAAFNSRDVVKDVKSSGKLAEIPDAAAAVDTLLVQARKALGLPDTTPVIVTGFSRGANLVVFTSAVPSLRQHLAGAVAVALTRETDYLQPPDGVTKESGMIDDKGRIQTYPAIQRAGSLPFAVIQSNGDKYVSGDEARRLFGPDSPTRRLYQVAAKNHGFSGGQDQLLHDLDDALQWVESAVRTK